MTQIPARTHASAVIAAALLLTGLAAAPSAHAIPGNYQIVQTQTFTQSFSAFTNGSDYYLLVSPNSATLNPFSSYSTGGGTLNQVTIRWDNQASFSGTSGPNNGTASAGSGGTVYVGATGYNGNGSGNGISIGPNQPGSFTFSYTGSNPADIMFTPAGSGVSYSPAVYAVLWGSAPISLSEDVGGSLTTNGFASGLYQLTSTVTMTFDYFGEPVPVSAPGSVLLVGLGLAGVFARRRPSRQAA